MPHPKTTVSASANSASPLWGGTRPRRAAALLDNQARKARPRRAAALLDNQARLARRANSEIRGWGCGSPFPALKSPGPLRFSGPLHRYAVPLRRKRGRKYAAAFP